MFWATSYIWAVLPTGRNFGRKTQKWLLKNISGRKNPRPEKSAAEFVKNWPKSGRTFLNCVIHIKAFIIARNRPFNTLMGSKFVLLFGQQV
jgi:hypothetical protein